MYAFLVLLIIRFLFRWKNGFDNFLYTVYQKYQFLQKFLQNRYFVITVTR